MEHDETRGICKNCGTDVPLGTALCPTCATATEPGAPRLPAAPPPRSLGGKFEIVREIGRGGFGTVYEARDTALDRSVAVKVFEHAAMTAEERRGFEQRFQREARSAARLVHPHIVTVFEAGTDGDASYLVMELVRGETVRQALERDGAFSGEATLRIGRALASALSFAHREGIVHRDIKPENLMLREDGELKLADFGVAKMLSSGAQGLTKRGDVLGTPAYMAPEQIKEHALDERADIFSASAVLYELATGRRAFAAGSIAAVIHKILNEDPVAPRELDGRVPASLSDAIMMGLAKDPEVRYRDGSELAAALSGLDAEPGRAWLGKSLAEQMLEEEGDETAAGVTSAGAPGAASAGPPPGPTATPAIALSDHARGALVRTLVDMLQSRLLAPRPKGGRRESLVAAPWLAAAGHADVALGAVRTFVDGCRARPDELASVLAPGGKPSLEAAAPILGCLDLMDGALGSEETRGWLHWFAGELAGRLGSKHGLASASLPGGAALFHPSDGLGWAALLRSGAEPTLELVKRSLGATVKSAPFAARALAPRDVAAGALGSLVPLPGKKKIDLEGNAALGWALVESARRGDPGSRDALGRLLREGLPSLRRPEGGYATRAAISGSVVTPEGFAGGGDPLVLALLLDAHEILGDADLLALAEGVAARLVDGIHPATGLPRAHDGAETARAVPTCLLALSLRRLAARSGNVSFRAGYENCCAGLARWSAAGIDAEADVERATGRAVAVKKGAPVADASGPVPLAIMLLRCLLMPRDGALSPERRASILTRVDADLL